MVKNEQENIKKVLHFAAGSYIIAFALSVRQMAERGKARLAQLAEHLTLNQGVQGSNP